jgi:hypothetical protein
MVIFTPFPNRMSIWSKNNFLNYRLNNRGLLQKNRLMKIHLDENALL